MSTPYTVGVDPGVRACGVGIVNSATRELVSAWLCVSPSKEDGGAAFLAMTEQVVDVVDTFVFNSGGVLDVIAVERQAVRGNIPKGGGPMVLKSKNPQQQVELGHVAGMILFGLRSAKRRFFLWPQTWNGNKKKPQSNAIVWDRLSKEERSRVENVQVKERDKDGGLIFVGRGNNVVDAIGIAKWAALQPRISSARVPPPRQEPADEDPWADEP